MAAPVDPDIEFLDEDVEFLDGPAASSAAPKPAPRPDVSGKDAFDVAALQAGAAPLGGMGFWLGAEDAMNKVVGEDPDESLPTTLDTSPVDMAAAVGKRVLGLQRRGVKLGEKFLTSPVDTTKNLFNEWDSAKARYDTGQEQIREDHPVASFLGAGTTGLASFPRSAAQAAFGGLVQAVPSTGDPVQDAARAGTGATLGATGFKYPLATSTGLLGYGAATGDTETALAGAVGVPAGVLAKVTNIPQKIGGHFGKKSESAINDSVIESSAQRSKWQDKLANVLSMIDERKSKLPAAAQKARAAVDDADVRLSRTKQDAETARTDEIRVRKEKLEAAQAKLEDAKRRAENLQTEHERAKVAEADRLVKEARARNDKALDEGNRGYSESLKGDEFKEFDARDRNQRWREALKSLANEISDERRFDKEQASVIESINALERSKGAREGRAVQGEYQAYALMQQQLERDPSLAARLSPEAKAWMDRVGAGYEQWMARRATEPPAKEYAQAEYDASLGPLLEKLATLSKSRMEGKSRNPLALVPKERAAALAKEHGLDVGDEAQFDHLAVSELPLQAALAARRKALAAQKAEQFGLDPGDLSEFNPDARIDRLARNIRNPVSKTSEQPTVAARGPSAAPLEPTVVPDAPAGGVRAAFDEVDAPPVDPFQEGGEIPMTRLGRILSQLEDARVKQKRAEDLASRRATEASDPNPTSLTVRRLMRALEDAQTKRSRVASRAEEADRVAREPNLDPLISRRTAAADRIRGEISTVEEGMRPEAIVARGEDVLRRDADIQNYAGADSVMGTVRKLAKSIPGLDELLAGPSKEALKDPAARAAYFRRLEKRFKAVPSLAPHVPKLQGVISRGTPAEVKRFFEEVGYEEDGT